MIILISGAKKNVGDYLIVERAYKLLYKFVDEDIIVLNRFQDFNNKIDLLNTSRAIVLGGGPAYTPNFHELYPFLRYHERIKTSIIPMGLGWNGKPFDNYDDFVFNPQSLDILQSIHQNIAYSSCRDILTKKILANHNINNVLMTGCPVWYNLDYIGKTLSNNHSLKKIVITTGAKPGLLQKTMSLIKLIKGYFPKSEIYLSFHRGITPGKYTPPRRGISYSLQAIYGMIQKLNIKNVSGGLEKLEFYNTCDLHIGYRVHAHLYFLSHRKPSILINEDGRGLGMTKSLDLPEFSYNQKNLIDDIRNKIEFYMNENFNSFNYTFAKIDESFNTMQQFLKTIR